MYETIDPARDNEALPIRARRRLWLGFAILAVVAVLAAAAVMSSRQSLVPQVDAQAVKAESLAYRTALSDKSAALRRARLRDFVKAYPQSSRLRAAKAQLQIIEHAEAKDWSELTHIIFDTEQLANTKLKALSRYEAIWDTRLLGGREEEVKKFRENMKLDTDVLPDRNLPVEIDGNIQNMPGDALVGGARIAPQMGYIPPPVSRVPVTLNIPQDIVEPARVRRNKNPRYPRRALERGVSAVVVLDLYIDARGRVDMTELVLVDAQRYAKDFVKAAERAAMRTRYHPRLLNGAPVPTQALQKTYRFEVDN